MTPFAHEPSSGPESRVTRVRELMLGLAVFLLAHANGAAVAADEPQDAVNAVAVEVELDIHDMTYYREGNAAAKRIADGDFKAAERRIARLVELRQAQAFVVADVHNAIGMAYGEAGHFESAVAQLEKVLDIERDVPVGVVAESRAYLVYLHAALGRFEKAAELLGPPRITPPWPYARLAAVYAEREFFPCAVANWEKALRLGNRAGSLVPLAVAQLAAEWPVRDEILADWSQRLQTLRNRAPPTSTGEAATASVPPTCVGG